MDTLPRPQDAERPANFTEKSSQNRTEGAGRPLTRTPAGAGALNPQQRAVLKEAPMSCRGILERAYNGNSKAAGIKAFCLRCVGYIRADVQGCTSYGCPLHPYRPYQQDDEADEDATGTN